MSAPLALALALALGALAGASLAEERALDLGGGKRLAYTVLDPTSSLPSARGAATEILQLLAQGRLEEAAARSNAPGRRLEVLRGFQSSVGEERFKELYSQYLASDDRLVAEIARGKHRLLVWSLGDSATQSAGQFYVEHEGRFVMDDIPGPERAELQRVLRHYRGATPSGRKD